MRLDASKRVILVVVCSLSVAGLGGWVLGHHLAIAYHKRMMLSAMEAALRVGPNDNRQSDYIESFEFHRDALVSLGYFERLEFPLWHMKPHTDKWRALYEALQGSFTSVADGYFEMDRGEPRPPMVTVWARPGQRARYEAMISKFDVPPKGQVSGMSTPQKD
jgi:hypothetical protein